MTHLCASIAVDAPAEVDAALAAAVRAAEQGADLVEWRLDALAEADGAVMHARRLVAGSPVPCIVTVRTVREGGEWRGADMDRIAFLEALCTGDPAAAPAYVDFELEDARRSANLRQKLLLCVAHPGQVRAVPTRLILSAHDFSGRPATLARTWAAMAEDDACAVAKVAWSARSVRDNVEAFEFLRTRTKPAIALCMGEAGLMSRVLAPKFGAFLSFAHAGPDAEAERAAARAAGTAPGQPSVQELVERYGFRRIGPGTRVFGVIGWPVAHSRSPELHNRWFRERGADAVFLPIPVPPEYEHLKATVLELAGFGPLDFRGASVTLPHKEHLVRLVREAGGAVDPLAARIGAANTLLVRADGTLECRNTDAPAAVEALCDGMRIGIDGLRDRRIALLGAGGVARAVATGLADHGARVVVFNRGEERARRMCDELASGRDGAAGPSGGACGALEGRIVPGRVSELGCGCFHAFVNCTPVGMAGGPDPGGSPLPDSVPLDDSVTVMDTVYAPRDTPLVREARSRGARVVDGWAMFERQAALQARLWRTE